MSKEDNVKRMIEFDRISHLPAKEIRTKLLVGQHHQLKCWQKAILPYWFWAWMMEAKHEAFRFKYDTEALEIVERDMMKSVGIGLYINSAVYYFIVVVCPMVFVNACGDGLRWASHIIYLTYAFANAIFEVTVVLRIQRRLKNKEILQFNRWHAVELFMG